MIANAYKVEIKATDMDLPLVLYTWLRYCANIVYTKEFLSYKVKNKARHPFAFFSQTGTKTLFVMQTKEFFVL